MWHKHKSIKTSSTRLSVIGKLPVYNFSAVAEHTNWHADQIYLTGLSRLHVWYARTKYKTTKAGPHAPSKLAKDSSNIELYS